MMTTTFLTRLTQDFITVFNSHNVERMLSFYTHDCTLEDDGSGLVYHGLSEVRQYYTCFFKAFPDARRECKSDFQMRDWWVCECIISGTHSGDLSAAGNIPELPATGKNASWKVASNYELRNDKISRETTYWNPVSLMKQLDLLQISPKLSPTK